MAHKQLTFRSAARKNILRRIGVDVASKWHSAISVLLLTATTPEMGL
jgi:hypothetical protein